MMKELKHPTPLAALSLAESSDLIRAPTANNKQQRAHCPHLRNPVYSQGEFSTSLTHTEEQKIGSQH